MAVTIGSVVTFLVHRRAISICKSSYFAIFSNAFSSPRASPGMATAVLAASTTRSWGLTGSPCRVLTSSPVWVMARPACFSRTGEAQVASHHSLGLGGGRGPLHLIASCTSFSGRTNCDFSPFVSLAILAVLCPFPHWPLPEWAKKNSACVEKLRGQHRSSSPDK